MFVNAQCHIQRWLTVSTKGCRSPSSAPPSKNKLQMTIQIDFLSFHAWCDMTTYHDVFANFGNGWRWHSGPHRTNEMAAAHFRMLCVLAAVRRGWLQFRKRGTSLPLPAGGAFSQNGL